MSGIGICVRFDKNFRSDCENDCRICGVDFYREMYYNKNACLEQDYYEELEMTMHEMKETSRKLEDVADMAENQQDKNMLMKIAQKEKENSQYIKQLVEK